MTNPAPLDAETIAVVRASVCKQPSTPEIAALDRLMADVLPTDARGTLIDLAPGQPLPEGATAADRPDLYPAAEWVTGLYCRCWPERCRRPQPGPADDPDPVSVERGRPPGAER